MVNDLPTMNSQPLAVQVDGKTYMVHPLNFEEMGELQQWIYEQQRTQVMTAVEEAVARNKLPIEVQKFMALGALDVLARNRIMIGTAEADQLMNSIDGVVYMAYLGVRKGDPTFKLEDATPIAKAILENAVGDAIRVQIVEAVDVIGKEDPKSTAPGNGSQMSGAPQKSEWIGGPSMLKSPRRKSTPGNK